MTHDKFQENIKSFIYENIDSVEQLDVLLFLRKNCGKRCTAEEISKEFRSTVSSVNGRLENLKNKGFIKVENSSTTTYQYLTGTEEIEQVLTALTEEYRVKRHLVLEIIFSPAKKAKDFANSFILGNPNKKNGDENG